MPRRIPDPSNQERGRRGWETRRFRQQLLEAWVNAFTHDHGRLPTVKEELERRAMIRREIGPFR